jgi:transcription initiation factor TFIID TATA-box-binding protein
VVGIGFLGYLLDLEKIAEKGMNLSYDPSAFAPLVMRIRNPSASAMIFKSGKMIVTGTKSEADCKLAAEIFAKTVSSYGYKSVNGLAFRIVNLSATCNIQFRVRVHVLGTDKIFGNKVT